MYRLFRPKEETWFISCAVCDQAPKQINKCSKWLPAQIEKKPVADVMSVPVTGRTRRQVHRDLRKLVRK